MPKRAERDDKGFNPALGDQQAVRKPEGRAQHDGQNHAGSHRHQRRAQHRRHRIHEEDHRAGNQRRHRAHGQVNAAGDDDKTHADGNDADEGRAGEHVHDVVVRGEVAVQQRAGNAQQHQADHRPEPVQRAPPGWAGAVNVVSAAYQRVPVAWAINSSSVSWASCRVAQQAAGTHHRDAVAQPDQLHQLGRNHDDGQAAQGQLLDQVVDFALGADVDTARGFIQHDHRGRGMQDLGQRQLLLVAARQAAALASSDPVRMP
jgi:hypothetical protein